MPNLPDILKPNIANCVAYVEETTYVEYVTIYYVAIKVRSIIEMEGPKRCTKRGAIVAWNKLISGFTHGKQSKRISTPGSPK